MVLNIDNDQRRFKQIVQGKVRENLRKYINHGEMIGRQGKEFVSIPLPQLDIPHFRYGKNGSGGVGQGAGEVGSPLGPGKDGDAPGPAGSEPGEHILEVELSLAELAQILGDELELPRIEPKGKASLEQEKTRYTSIRRTGPESLRHFKRTYVQALRRQISTNTYDSGSPRVIPIRDDKRYRAWQTVQLPETNAAIIYAMDVSGSMTDEQKQIVRTEAFWINTWLASQYDGIVHRYVIHDAVAKEVDEETFYRTRESGGTRISSAYKVIHEIIRQDYPASDWNTYVFQFSDGDNWGEDNETSIRLLGQEILPQINLFCYGQVESPYGSGEYIKALAKVFGNSHEKLVLSEIENREGIFDSIKEFLGKGR
ncbi:MAG: DUF444 family protein [Pirellulales bacterium]|nr:DUF444 family protein [Pirellulales bacterium]